MHTHASAQIVCVHYYMLAHLKLIKTQKAGLIADLQGNW